MATFDWVVDQELAGRYVAIGSDRPVPSTRRMPRAAFVRDTIRAIYVADKKFGIDLAGNGSLPELLDASEEHLERITNAVGRSAPPSSTTGGDTT